MIIHGLFQGKTCSIGYILFTNKNEFFTTLFSSKFVSFLSIVSGFILVVFGKSLINPLPKKFPRTEFQNRFFISRGQFDRKIQYMKFSSIYKSLGLGSAVFIGILASGFYDT
ncbi:hypothetical protein CDIK_3323 [Cucumispora dikerogammari]|nr:hypothetical protein CDIK_3323 [Cucumispora dikerogammari]